MNTVLHVHLHPGNVPETVMWLNTNQMADHVLTLIPVGFQTQVVLKLSEDTLSMLRGRGVLWY